MSSAASSSSTDCGAEGHIKTSDGKSLTPYCTIELTGFSKKRRMFHLLFELATILGDTDQYAHFSVDALLDKAKEMVGEAAAAAVFHRIGYGSLTVPVERYGNACYALPEGNTYFDSVSATFRPLECRIEHADIKINGANHGIDQIFERPNSLPVLNEAKFRRAGCDHNTFKCTKYGKQGGIKWNTHHMGELVKLSGASHIKTMQNLEKKLKAGSVFMSVSCPNESSQPTVDKIDQWKLDMYSVPCQVRKDDRTAATALQIRTIVEFAPSSISIAEIVGQINITLDSLYAESQ